VPFCICVAKLFFFFVLNKKNSFFFHFYAMISEKDLINEEFLLHLHRFSKHSFQFTKK